MTAVFTHRPSVVARLAAASLLLAAPAAADTWSSEEPTVVLPGHGPASKSLVVDASFAIRDVDVILTLEHADTSQLRVSLEHPDGTTVLLFEGVPGTGFTHTVLDDEAAAALGGGSPYTKAFRPQSSLAALDDKPAAGDWTLVVEDLVAGGGGLLRCFSLAFNGRTWVAGGPVTMPLFGPTVSAVAVMEPLVVADADVTLTLQHSYTSDLTVSLSSPAVGDDVLLMVNVGGFTGPNGGYLGTTLDDEATADAAGAYPTFLGRFRTTYPDFSALSGLDGTSPLGLWRLKIFDQDFEDGGTFHAWSLHLVPETTCEGEASAASYGAGLAGTSGVPALSSDHPVLGEDVHLQLAGSAGVASPALVLGGVASAALAFKGGTLLVAPAFQVALTLGGQPVTLTAPLPDEGALCGAHVFLQLLQADAGAPQGVALSAGLELVLGS